MREVKFADNILHFVGNEIKVGDKVKLIGAPSGSFEQKEVDLSKTKYTVLATFPSINTGVCDMQVVRLNQLADEYKNFQFVSFSMDLPSALEAYNCEHSKRVVDTYSDYRDRVVANQLGLLIDELKLLGRALFILDREGTIVYKQINEQIVDQVDFDSLEKELKKLSK